VVILTGSDFNIHPFNGPFSRTTQVSQYQKGKTNLDFTEARDSEWQWHQLGHLQVCTLLQTDNHASTPLLSFLQAGCPSCRPTNSIKALKADLTLSGWNDSRKLNVWQVFTIGWKTAFFHGKNVLTRTRTHARTFNGPLSGTTQVSRYQKG